MSTNYYDTIKKQLSFQTGVQSAECPNCKNIMSFHVGGLRKDTNHNYGGRSYRLVRGGCRHCRMSFDFVWK